MKNKNQQRFEISAAIMTAIMKFIFMDWLNWKLFYIAGILLFWGAYIVYSVKSNKENLKLWGFKKEYFKQSMFFFTPLIFLSAIFSIYYGGSVIRSFPLQFILIFLLYPLWGLLQQFLMLGIIAQSLQAFTVYKSTRFTGIFFVAILFSAIHYPIFPLMIITFFLEVVFISVYLKWKNLWAIGIAHGWIATFTLYSLFERDLWFELFGRF